MPVLNIEGRKVKVDDNFLKLSPEQQADTVDEIAASLGIAPQTESAPDPEMAKLTGQVLSGDPEKAGLAVEREKGRQAGERASVGQTVGAGLQKGTLRNFSDEAAGLAEASGLPVGTPTILTAPIGGIRLGLDALGVTGGDATKRYDQMTERARGFHEGMTDAHPIASYGSQIAGGIASPAKTPLGFAAEGALYGAGDGETAGGRVAGGVIGGTVGGIVGKGVEKIMPGAPPSAPNAIVQAAERQGVPVSTAVATDSMLTQRAAQVAKNIPGAGNPLVRSTEETITSLGERAGQLASDLGGAGMEQAGETASKGVTGWIKGKSAKLVEAAYNAVDGLIDDTITGELQVTRGKVAEILAKRQNAHIVGESKAVAQVIDAVQSGGLNYQGIKTLRTTIGEMMNSGILPEGMSGAELKQIYGALTDDLKAIVEKAGGPQAAAKFARANSLNKVVAARRERLARVVGRDGNASPAQVYDRLVAAAGSKSRADTSLLLQARKAVGADEWSEISSAIVSRLGRDAEGNFSPDRFVTDFGRFSESGKSVLFGGAGNDLRQALDDIHTIASRLKDVHRKFGNPSGTGQTVAGGASIAGLFADPVTTISALVGANVFSRIVSRPATAKSMARYMKAQEAFVKKPTRGALSAVQTYAKQFSGTVSQELGVNVNLNQLLGGLKPSYADGQSNYGGGVGQ